MSSLMLPLLLAVMVPIHAHQPEPRSTLFEMRDRYRPILIFAPPGGEQLHTQLDMLTVHRSDLLDRQIMLVPFAPKWAGTVDTTIMTFMSQDEAGLRHRFHIHPNDFTVILLGKDGGEKFRSPTPVTIDQLSRIIDAMPMRQQELRERLR